MVRITGTRTLSTMRNNNFVRITIWVVVVAMVLTAFATGLVLFQS